jgi:hypothetical protein
MKHKNIHNHAWGIRVMGVYGCLLLTLGLLTAAERPARPVAKAPSASVSAEMAGIMPTETSTPTSAQAPVSPASGAPPTFTFTATATMTGTQAVAASPSETPTKTISPTITATFTITGTPTPSPTKTPVIARSGMALLPTGYSNRVNRVDGVNLDFLFTYYIGAIMEKRSTVENTEFLNPLRLWLFTADLKYCWLDENGNIPGLSTGFMDTLLLLGSAPGDSAATGQSFKFTASSMGSVYTAVSKTVASNTSMHLGYMRGNLRDVLGKLGKTVRKLSPNRNHADLLPLMTDDLADVRDESAPNIFYTGFDTKFLGTFWRFELWKPFPLSKEPILINSKIDRLFSFNLAYEKWQGGHAILGYFNFRFTIVPSAPKKAVLP